MKYLALASDYDGTLAKDGQVDPATVAALEQWQASGRQLILVTGRRGSSLQAAFPQLHMFDWVVAENGPLIYCPATGKQELIGPPIPDSFITQLKNQGVDPLFLGEAIASTHEPYTAVVQQTIQTMALDLHIILNKRAVMVLPKGINKATGLEVVLGKIGMDPQQVVGIGDAQNDEDLLAFCGHGVAVANALPGLKALADFVTQGERGDGVQEMIAQALGGNPPSPRNIRA